MKLFSLSLLAALTLAPAALHADDPTTPGKLGTTTSVPQPNPGSGARPTEEKVDRIPGKESTTTAVPQPTKESETKPSTTTTTTTPAASK